MKFASAELVGQLFRYIVDMCRPWALTVSVALVALIQIAVADGTPRWGYILLSSVAVACTVVGGFAINDYFDRDLDREAHPDRPIPSGRMKARTALWIALAAFCAAFALFALLDITALVIGVILIVLLATYTHLKNYYGPLGNIAMSAIVALAVVYGFFTGKPSSIHISFLLPFFLLAGGAFFALLSQESVKDVEDMEGERGFRRTIPLLWGPTAAFRLASASLAIAVVLLLLFVGSSLLENGVLGWVAAVLVIGYAMALIPMLFNATPDQATPLVRLLKVGFTGTLALLFFAY